MLPRRTKAFFYVAAGPLMRANGALYRAFLAPRDGIVKVQLGPGQKNYLPRLDQRRREHVHREVRRLGRYEVPAPVPRCDGRRLLLAPRHRAPARPGVSLSRALPLLEAGRGLPDRRTQRRHGDQEIRRGRRRLVHRFSRRRRSVGGRFENFIFCRQEHLTILTLFVAARARNRCRLSWRSSHASPAATPAIRNTSTPAVLALEPETTPECPHTLIHRRAETRLRRDHDATCAKEILNRRKTKETNEERTG